MQTTESLTGRRRAVRAAGVAAVAALAGCGINPFQEEENEAVLDFIHVNELEQVDQFRYFQQFTYTYVNDSYVTVPTNSGEYLVEFARTCPELRQLRITPDMMDQRHDNRTIRARFDTIRGCRIGKIYEISAAQAAELEELGDAPGEDVYLEDGEGTADADAREQENAGDAGAETGAGAESP